MIIAELPLIFLIDCTDVVVNITYVATGGPSILRLLKLLSQSPASQKLQVRGGVVLARPRAGPLVITCSHFCHPTNTTLKSSAGCFLKFAID